MAPVSTHFVRGMRPPRKSVTRYLCICLLLVKGVETCPLSSRMLSLPFIKNYRGPKVSGTESRGCE